MNQLQYLGGPVNSETAEHIFKAIYNEKISKRPGADKVLAWLESTDFFTAPASTKFHLCVPKGLVLHSVHVYLRLRAIIAGEKTDPVTGECMLTEEDEATIAIVGLLHDVCKTNCYITETKNRKQYDAAAVAMMQHKNPKEVKSDSKGLYFWEPYEKYTYEDNDPYGHGEKSVRLISKHGLDLTDAEEYSIRYHMGAWDLQGLQLNALSKAFTMYPLAAMTHIADAMATYLDETEDENVRV